MLIVKEKSCMYVCMYVRTCSRVERSCPPGLFFFFFCAYRQRCGVASVCVSGSYLLSFHSLLLSFLFILFHLSLFFISIIYIYMHMYISTYLFYFLFTYFPFFYILYSPMCNMSIFLFIFFTLGFSEENLFSNKIAGRWSIYMHLYFT